MERNRKWEEMGEPVDPTSPPLPSIAGDAALTPSLLTLENNHHSNQFSHHYSPHSNHSNHHSNLLPLENNLHSNHYSHHSNHSNHPPGK